MDFLQKEYGELTAEEKEQYKKRNSDKNEKTKLSFRIYGTFENLGHITMFASTRDILCPDDVKFSQMLTEQGVEHTFVCEEGLNHPYALFPIPEATDAREIIVEAIKGEY